MFFQKFKTPGLAHVAYLIGDKGEAALVDPRRDVEEYLSVAQRNGLAVKYVLETHRQEDFVIGSAEVRKRTGAKVVSGRHALFGHSDLRLGQGEAVSVGALTLRALETPGHTPESVCYAVFVEEAPGRALGVFTGDTLFIGESGRTDLTDAEETAKHAGELFDSVHTQLAPLGDQAIVWPAHGAGSVCGGKIAERDESTLGLERAYNPVFRLTREAFIASKVEERLPRPPYFEHMERVNLEGGVAVAKAATSVRVLSAEEFDADGAALIIDTRAPEAFAGGHILGSVNIWLAGLPVFGGWFANEQSRVYLVLPSAEDLAKAVTHLAGIGIDGVEAVLAGGFAAWRDAGMAIGYSETTDPRRLAAELDTTLVLDVREDSEFEEGHIDGACHLFVGDVDRHFERIAEALTSKPNIAVTCSVGHRAGIAVSLLERRGIRAKNLLGGMTAWKKLGLRTVRGTGRTITTKDIEGERS